MSPLLSIIICTVEERQAFLIPLVEEFTNQKIKATAPIEILVMSDNKEMSIGSKRQLGLRTAKGKWIVFFDDDDWPYQYYVQSTIDAIQSDEEADCVGINIFMTTNGIKPQRCLHRFGLKWENKYGLGGWDYHRDITHFNPVLKSKALQAGFRDMRFGEDRDYCDRLNPLLKKEVYIEEPLFHYRYTTNIHHNKKYGIT